MIRSIKVTMCDIATIAYCEPVIVIVQRSRLGSLTLNGHFKNTSYCELVYYNALAYIVQALSYACTLLQNLS